MMSSSCHAQCVKCALVFSSTVWMVSPTLAHRDFDVRWAGRLVGRRMCRTWSHTHETCEHMPRTRHLINRCDCNLQIAFRVKCLQQRHSRIWLEGKGDWHPSDHQRLARGGSHGALDLRFPRDSPPYPSSGWSTSNRKWREDKFNGYLKSCHFIHFIIRTNPLLLQQIVLSLGRNALLFQNLEFCISLSSRNRFRSESGHTRVDAMSKLGHGASAMSVAQSSPFVVGGYMLCSATLLIVNKLTVRLYSRQLQSLQAQLA